MPLRSLTRALLPLLVVIGLAGCQGSAGGDQVEAKRARPPGTLALSASSYSATQNAGAVTITVNRLSGSYGDVGVGYTTADGTAVAGRDYTAVTGTVRWANGDTSAKSFSVPISNATPFSGNRAFTVSLTSATGGASIGKANRATITINGSRVPTGAMGAAAASRLLTQGTFGPSMSSIDAAATQTYDQWFAAQAQARPSLTYPFIKDATDNANWIPYWWRNAVQGPDQLRQRMAWALSQIFVVSGQSGALFANNRALAFYYDLLTQNALGNYRQLLENVSLSLQMGVYLNMYHSNKANEATGIHADQNFAREIMQLFTVGLVELNLDGTAKLGSNGRPIPTYGYPQIENLANAFTGWASNPTTQTGENAYLYDYDFTRPMVGYQDHHDTNAKTIIGGVTIPAGGTPASDLKIALDTLANHPNTAPFISKLLIQRLVTSNPTPAFVQRVATVFNNNGSGVRGDLLAVARAILTDSEAINVRGNTDGKLREPLLRLTNLWRAFDGRSSTGAVNEYGIVQDAYARMGQAPLASATVFNFYQPDYVRVGPLATAGLVVPEFQITNENTLTLITSEFIRQAYQFEDSTGKRYAGYQGFDEAQNLGTESVLLHTASWESLATNPSNLIARMNQVLMQGQMPNAMFTTLVNYVSAIPSTEEAYRARRVVEAADLILNSPQYAVQR